MLNFMVMEKMNYDLEKRTLDYAVRSRLFVKGLDKSLINMDDLKQFVRSSGSVGANYIEANEALSKKDFIMRIKISLKETKECNYWLNIIMETNKLNQNSENECKSLYKEAIELRKILSSILRKSK